MKKFSSFKIVNEGMTNLKTTKILCPKEKEVDILIEELSSLKVLMEQYVKDCDKDACKEITKVLKELDVMKRGGAKKVSCKDGIWSAKWSEKK